MVQEEDMSAETNAEQAVKHSAEQHHRPIAKQHTEREQCGSYS